MDETGFGGDVDEWPDTVPWWVDAAAVGDLDLASSVPADLAGDGLVVVDDGAGPGLLTAEQVLLAAGLVGAGPDGQRLLASLVGRGDLSQDEWLTAAQLWEAQDAWLAGQKGLAVAGFAGPEPVTVAGFRDDEALMIELALATGSAEGFAYAQIQSARALTSTLVRTGDLLRAGRLSPYRARLIVDELTVLHPDVARQVEDRVLGTAAQVPTGRLKAALARHAKRADRQAVNDRKVTDLAEKTKGRRVVFDPDAADGLMGLYAYLPPVEALAVKNMLQQAAGAYRKADGRSHDQRMADTLTGMVIGFDPEHPTLPITPKTLVQLLIDLPTLLRLRDHDGELLGYGHLPADVVRELTDNASWQRLVYDPVDGHLLDAGTTIHDFPQLTAYLHLRDRYDRFPGGTHQTHHDLDHTKAFKTNNGTGGGDNKPTTGEAAPQAATTRRRRHGTTQTATATATEVATEPTQATPTVPDTEATDASPATGADPATGNDAVTADAATTGQVEPPTLAATGAPNGTHARVPDGNGLIASADLACRPHAAPQTDAMTAEREQPRQAEDEGGRTAANNMAALSRRHHRAKTFLSFHYRHLDNAVLEWTTPLGRTYYTRPHDYRPDGDTEATGDSDPPPSPGSNDS